MISDEIINHFQFIKKNFFIVIFPSEVETNFTRIFWYSIRAKFACSVFLSYFFKASHYF